jgi:two-component system, NarL family, response regulator LiaR
MPPATLRLEGLAVGLWGRHELYLMSLAALLSHLGAEICVVEDPDPAKRPEADIDVLLLESPLVSEVVLAAADGPPVIALQDGAYQAGAEESLLFGASAVLPKSASLAELTRAIEEASRQRSSEALRELTKRQREVLRLLAEGLDNMQIAARLGISLRTARAHVSSVLERLGVENRTQAAVTAVRRGWIA